MKCVVAIASDHHGFKLKSKIINSITDIEINYLDLGTNNTVRVDYPDYAAKLSETMLEERINFGILICSSGIGMSIAANRYVHIRAALCFNLLMVKQARQHNNANVLIIGSKIIEETLVIRMIDQFISTTFEGGRHIERLKKIS